MDWQYIMPTLASYAQYIRGQSLELGELTTAVDQNTELKTTNNRLPPSASRLLEDYYYNISVRPTSAQKEELCEKTGLDRKQIDKWFANARNRRGHTNVEQGCAGSAHLPTSSKNNKQQASADAQSTMVKTNKKQEEKQHANTDVQQRVHLARRDRWNEHQQDQAAANNKEDEAAQKEQSSEVEVPKAGSSRTTQKTCCVYGCINVMESEYRPAMNKDVERTTRYYSFPVNHHMRKMWVDEIKKHCPPGYIPASFRTTWTPLRHAAVCSLHFTYGDLISNTFSHELRPNAVPSVFPMSSYSSEAVMEGAGSTPNLHSLQMYRPTNNSQPLQIYNMMGPLQYATSNTRLRLFRMYPQNAPISLQSNASDAPSNTYVSVMPTNHRLARISPPSHSNDSRASSDSRRSPDNVSPVDLSSNATDETRTSLGYHMQSASVRDTCGSGDTRGGMVLPIQRPPTDISDKPSWWSIFKTKGDLVCWAYGCRSSRTFLTERPLCFTTVRNVDVPGFADVSFHVFPRVVNMWNQWYGAMCAAHPGMYPLADFQTEFWFRSTKARLCSRHFRSEDYKERPNSTPLLNRQAVPSVFYIEDDPGTLSNSDQRSPDKENKVNNNSNAAAHNNLCVADDINDIIVIKSERDDVVEEPAVSSNKTFGEASIDDICSAAIDDISTAASYEKTAAGSSKESLDVCTKSEPLSPCGDSEDMPTVGYHIISEPLEDQSGTTDSRGMQHDESRTCEYIEIGPDYDTGVECNEKQKTSPKQNSDIGITSLDDTDGGGSCLGTKNNKKSPKESSADQARPLESKESETPRKNHSSVNCGTTNNDNNDSSDRNGGSDHLDITDDMDNQLAGDDDPLHKVEDPDYTSIATCGEKSNADVMTVSKLRAEDIGGNCVISTGGSGSRGDDKCASNMLQATNGENGEQHDERSSIGFIVTTDQSQNHHEQADNTGRITHVEDKMQKNTTMVAGTIDHLLATGASDSYDQHATKKHELEMRALSNREQKAKRQMIHYKKELQKTKDKMDETVNTLIDKLAQERMKSMMQEQVLKEKYTELGLELCQRVSSGRSHATTQCSDKLRSFAIDMYTSSQDGYDTLRKYFPALPAKPTVDRWVHASDVAAHNANRNSYKAQSVLSRGSSSSCTRVSSGVTSSSDCVSHSRLHSNDKRLTDVHDDMTEQGQDYCGNIASNNTSTRMYSRQTVQSSHNECSTDISDILHDANDRCDNAKHNGDIDVDIDDSCLDDNDMESGHVSVVVNARNSDMVLDSSASGRQGSSEEGFLVSGSKIQTGRSNSRMLTMPDNTQDALSIGDDGCVYDGEDSEGELQIVLNDESLDTSSSCTSAGSSTPCNNKWTNVGRQDDYTKQKSEQHISPTDSLVNGSVCNSDVQLHQVAVNTELYSSVKSKLCNVTRKTADSYSEQHESYTTSQQHLNSVRNLHKDDKHRNVDAVPVCSDVELSGATKKRSKVISPECDIYSKKRRHDIHTSLINRSACSV